MLNHNDNHRPVIGIVSPGEMGVSRGLPGLPLNHEDDTAMLNHNDNHRPVIGIVSPGEMGVSLGSLLLEHGFAVITTVEGRSPHTIERCNRAGLRQVRTLKEVVAESEIFLSLVTPDAAVRVAEQYFRAASSLRRPPLYVEANSISPMTAKRIERLVGDCGAAMVDASIFGLATRLGERGLLLLSGPEADDLAAIVTGVLRVETLGERCGTASMFKMLLGGVNKGVVALFVEIGLAALEADLLEPFLRTCRTYYPGLMEMIDRLLPTLPRHARRRAAEMEELQCTLHALGLPLGLADEIQRLYRLLGDAPLPECAEHIDGDSATTAELLELIRSVVSLKRAPAEIASVGATRM